MHADCYTITSYRSKKRVAMAVRLSIRKVFRDSSMILFGTLVGILLARTFLEDVYRTECGQRVLNHDKRNTNRLHKTKQQLNLQEITSQDLGRTRPKTLREELHSSIRKPLLVGVVTAQKLLQTRAVAVNRTWGSKAPNLFFFASDGAAYGNLPVVGLPGVDDTYPPQKKVYRMLKYMYDNHLNDYNWFMRADDDIYVRVECLIQFLNNLDPTNELYIGQPGLGKPEDLQRIKLQPHEHYCMGGPGVIFSRALLEKLGPHLESCLQHEVVSWNEDLEVGRCISRRLAIQCTWNYEMSQLFYMDYSKGEIFRNADVYNNRKLPNVLTVHAFKEPEMMYKIHQFFMELEVIASQARTTQLKSELADVAKLTGRLKAFS